ncbi:MAG: RlmE family RNA methyltransferase [Planctomycetota bacterium]
MPKPRILQDQYFKKAKAEGFLARSAYKLQEINERQAFIKPGDKVLDLGCAPGSWLQVAAQIVGSQGGNKVGGQVVGIDLKESDPAVRESPLVTDLVGDIFTTDAATLLAPIQARDYKARMAAGTPLPTRLYDVVMSDMAPNTTGHADDFISARLCRRVLELLPGLLREGGQMAMKIFEGSEYPGVLAETSRIFAKARGFKPHASRDVSREMYIVGQSFAPHRAVKPRPSRPVIPRGWGSGNANGGA